MKKNIIYINILLVLFGAVNSFSAILEEIDKVEQFSAIRLYFSFDSAPKYSVDQTGRRINLSFTDTTPTESVVLPSEDQNIIRYAITKSKDLLTISLFLRYLPEKYSLNKIDNNKLVFELIPGSIYTKSFKDLERQLDGSIHQQDDIVSKRTPLTESEYPFNWKSFYSQYEADVKIDVPVKLTWPPFPIMQFSPPHYEKNIDLLPPELIQAALNGSWGELNFEIPKLINEAIEDPEKQKLLALTYGEILGRQGDFVGSYKQLYLLAEKYPGELLATFADYLMLLLQAINTDIYLANHELKNTISEFPPENGLLPYALITEIETALATNNLKQMNTLLLRDDVAFPDESEQLRNMRQADYWYSLGQPIKAAAAYNLIEDVEVIDNYKFSLNGYCDTLYRQKKFIDSGTCYRKLEQTITDPGPQSLIRYRKILSQSKALKENLQNRFEQLALSSPDQEGGVRAHIKTYDIDMLETKNIAAYSYLGDSYIKVAQSYLDRFTSEEAYFKGALAYYLAGESQKSTKILMQLLREFQSGALRSTTQALLLQVLPVELKRLSDKELYKELLILAQQNAFLYTNEWIDKESVIHVANAYLTVGLYEEAHNLYLHLVTNGALPIRQKMFLPLIKSAYKAGMYDRVDDYATRYKFNFPDDKDMNQVLIYQSKALFSVGKYQRALSILPDPIPDNPLMLRLGMNVFFYNGKYDKSLELIERFTPENDAEKDESIFIKAESLYQTGKKVEADKLFKTIKQESIHWPQAMYRQAEFLRESDKNNEAITILKNLVKNSNSTNWSKLAKQDIKFIQNSTID